jgi:hypothetical protein
MKIFNQLAEARALSKRWSSKEGLSRGSTGAEATGSSCQRASKYGHQPEPNPPRKDHPAPCRRTRRARAS